eukprot:837460-Amphidinium_carterae.2
MANTKVLGLGHLSTRHWLSSRIAYGASGCGSGCMAVNEVVASSPLSSCDYVIAAAAVAAADRINMTHFAVELVVMANFRAGILAAAHGWSNSAGRTTISIVPLTQASQFIWHSERSSDAVEA